MSPSPLHFSHCGGTLLGGRRAWVVIAAGMGVYFAANLVLYAPAAGVIGPLGFPSIADALYLSAYLLLGAGLFLVPRRNGRNPRNSDWGAVVDTLIITGGVAAASWEFLIEPNLVSGPAPPVARLVSIGYPLMDLFLLAMAIRLVLREGIRSTAAALLGGFVLIQFIADSLYGIGQIDGHLPTRRALRAPLDRRLRLLHRRRLGSQGRRPSGEHDAMTTPSPVGPARS